MIRTIDPVGMLQAITTLHDDSATFLNAIDIENPSPDSPADKELRSFPLLKKQLIGSYGSQGFMLIEATADHLMGLVKTLTEPVQTIAPWACIRALLEASTLACWLLDPGISGEVRLQRSFAWRYEGLSQQLHLANAKKVRAKEKKDTSLEAEAQLLIDKVTAQIDKVEHDALGLGYQRIWDKKHKKRNGIGQEMPTMTNLVRGMLEDEEETYRVSSAMAHNENWAMLRASYRKISADGAQLVGTPNDPDDLILHEKYMPTEIFAALCFVGAINFARPNWYNNVLFGGDLKQLGAVFDKSFDSMKIAEQYRFWKHGH